jgi:hypothetical protein
VASWKAGVTIDAIAEAEGSASARSLGRRPSSVGILLASPAARPTRSSSPWTRLQPSWRSARTWSRNRSENGGLLTRRGEAGRDEVERLMFERWITEAYWQTREWIEANPGTFARGSE